jgi:hypothetical protein
MLILDSGVTSPEDHNLVVVYLETGTDFHRVPERLPSDYVEDGPSIGTNGVLFDFRNHQVVGFRSRKWNREKEMEPASEQENSVASEAASTGRIPFDVHWANWSPGVLLDWVSFTGVSHLAHTVFPTDHVKRFPKTANRKVEFLIWHAKFCYFLPTFLMQFSVVQNRVEKINFPSAEIFRLFPA